MGKRIPLTKGHVAIVDNADFYELIRWKWSYSNGYAVRKVRTRTGTKSLGMHQQIMGTPDDLLIDHKNGDRLDNQRNNLRACEHITNNMNRGPNKKKSASAYKGVHLRKGRKKNPWYSQIGYQGKSIYLGVFPTEKDAAIAYNTAARRYYGDSAWLNPM